MNMGKEIILIGGGHCRSCIDVIEQEGKYSIAGIIEATAKEEQNKKILGYSVIGTDTDLPSLANKYSCLITIGQIKSVKPRLHLFEQLQDIKASLPVVISPMAYVSKHAETGILYCK